MKILYLECNMGAAGDMLGASLLELCPDPAKSLERLNGMGIPGVLFSAESSEKCGIRGTHMRVTVKGQEEEIPESGHYSAEAHLGGAAIHTEHVCGGHRQGEADHDHSSHVHGEAVHDYGGHGHGVHDHSGHTHADLHDIKKIVGALHAPPEVRGDILKVYRMIAEAESHAHGRPVAEVHFHEVGAMDAVADIAAFCMLLREISPDTVIASPVNVGFGEVECAHGILPVPAPAAAWILRDVPVYAGRWRGEMCTPTGAALLKTFACGFEPMPQMRISGTGIGCGRKDFPQANIVRAMLGETAENAEMPGGTVGADEIILELSCNLDDMTPEEAGFAMDMLFSEGALDVFFSPVTMKKSRPGIILSCLCRPELRSRITACLFRHTTTLGVRVYECTRHTLSRGEEILQTPRGEIRLKTSSGWGVRRRKYEYEDLACIARAENMTLDEVRAFADKTVEAGGSGSAAYSPEFAEISEG